MERIEKVKQTEIVQDAKVQYELEHWSKKICISFCHIIQLVFAITFIILYGNRDISSRNQGDEYQCVMVEDNGLTRTVTTSDWSNKWIRAYALNYWLYVFLALFHIIGILGACLFTLRLIAWCSICVMNPIHLIVVIYTTIVRYN